MVSSGDLTNAFEVAYVWDNSLNDGNGSYKIFFGYPLPPGIDQNLFSNDPIPAMQAFWLKATATGASLSFKPDYQGTSQVLYKTRSDNATPGVPWLSLEISSGDFSDQVLLFAGSEDTPSFDVPKLKTIASKYVELALVDEQNNWISKSLSMENASFPLRFSSTETGTFTFSWQGLDRFGGDKIFTLVDTFTEQEIALEEGGEYTFEVTEEQQATNRFVLEVGEGSLVSNEPGSELPTSVELQQNYPNPFNPRTTIAFGTPETGKVTLEVFDVLGRKVATLLAGENKAAGRHTVTFNASNLASGMYIYRLQAGSTVITKKLTLIK